MGKNHDAETSSDDAENQRQGALLVEVGGDEKTGRYNQQTETNAWLIFKNSKTWPC